MNLVLLDESRIDIIFKHIHTTEVLVKSLILKKKSPKKPMRFTFPRDQVLVKSLILQNFDKGSLSPGSTLLAGK
jgi:hypothetical protein